MWQSVSRASWRTTKQLVFERAKGCCEYCQTCEDNTGQPMHIEHIDPHGGDDLDNLCLSCSSCNLSKAVATSAKDPETDTVVPLFNPRINHWYEHFEWSENGLILLGKTPIGRATIERLKMNQERLIRARSNWIEAGNHPPPKPA
ncbi:MAG: HNH endonuclease [Chloroflexi bacterium]|nr:HNH endonuclease [Chloroflexota bacterium]NOG65913.1 HNH endonuclease [Chloroflexota bacterium]